MIAIRTAAGAALLLLAATTAACSKSPTTDGAPVGATDAPAVAPSTSTSSAITSPSASTVTSTVASSAPQTSVVVVTAPTQPQTVTRTVQAPPQQSGPQTSSSLLALYDDSSAVDSSDYYNGDGLFFDSPSQNIGCYLTDGDYITCSIHRYDFPQPGPDCDRGIAATLDSSGFPELTDCSGYFPVADRGGVLQYGDSISDGDVACISESSGVSCLDLETDTGFTLAREAFTPVS